MGRSHRRRIFAHAGCRQQGSGQKSLCHGGTGTVNAQKGNFQRPQSICGTGALIDQISGTDTAELGFLHAALFQRQQHGLPLHGTLRLFPGLLSEMGIRFNPVKARAHRAFALFFSCHGRITDDARRQGILKHTSCQCSYHLQFTSLTVCAMAVHLYAAGRNFPENRKNLHGYRFFAYKHRAGRTQ